MPAREFDEKRRSRQMRKSISERSVWAQIEPWSRLDTQNAHRLWAEHVEKKRFGHAGKRPVADVLIEAFAQRFQGLITRNPKHFTSVPVVVP